MACPGRTRAYPGHTPIFTPGPPWVRRAGDRAARHRPREGMGSSHGRARVERRERSSASGSDPGHPAPPRGHPPRPRMGFSGASHVTRDDSVMHQCPFDRTGYLVHCLPILSLTSDRTLQRTWCVAVCARVCRLGLPGSAARAPEADPAVISLYREEGRGAGPRSPEQASRRAVPVDSRLPTNLVTRAVC
jgi:hypothetical protein